MREKMRLLQINSYNHLSTGKIMMDISDLAANDGIESFTACPAARTMYAHKAKNQIFIGTIVGRSLHRLFSEYSGYHGMASIVDTLFFLAKASKIKPDIIHLHNLHGSYVNIPLLFRYFRKHPQIKVVWTFHDCWPFTGGCPHFEMLKCNKWKTHCEKCQYEGYPRGKKDKTFQMYKLKKKLFMAIPNLEIVCPSQWLADLVKVSFFNNRPVHVINNGIDLDVFKPQKGGFRQRYGIENKFIILGVASTWSYRKGLDVFVELAKSIPDSCVIVMVGVTEDISSQLPESIIAIKRTNNIDELVDIYSSSDIFFNPTREDTFPTVNIEALACGTPVVTFQSGGSPEIIDISCGLVVSESDYFDSIMSLERNNYLAEACRKRAMIFSKIPKLSEYIDLYHALTSEEEQL